MVLRVLGVVPGVLGVVLRVLGMVPRVLGVVLLTVTQRVFEAIPGPERWWGV